MTSDNHDPLQRLAKLLARLPGIGEKSALRLALAIVRSETDYTRALAEAITAARGRMRLCSVCCDISTDKVCSICSDARRDGSLLCVVAHPQDRMALERAAVFRGRYHVLHGVLDPLAGVGPNELKISALVDRLGGTTVAEVIVATSPSVEGDATAIYLAKLLAPLGVAVSRIAAGVAVGSDIEFADMTTLLRAFEGRRQM